ncbi:MAG: ribosomal protection-like ABC-F family protein [Christensenellales bacterium]|jgi:ATP-binding cassette subfamily F protein 3
MADINVNAVTKSFQQDRVVLDAVSFQVDRGERVGLLGANGAGKTTLLKIITGEIAPDSGSAGVAKGLRLGYVAQLGDYAPDARCEDVLRAAFARAIELGERIAKLQADMTVGDAARYTRLTDEFLALGGYEWETELNKVANGLGIDREMRERRFLDLSGGERTRVNLARLILERTDVLILDEPTNHLDTGALEWLEEYLVRGSGTVLVVSHDRYFLDAVVTRIIEIERGKPQFYGGNYTFYAQEKEIRYRQQMMRYQREQSKIKQLEFQIQRLKAWGSVYDNPALHKRAAAMEKRVVRTRQTDRPLKSARMDAGFASDAFRADRVLWAAGLSKAYGEKQLFQDVDCEMRGGGERIALVGPNGSGKTTFLKILMGLEPPDAGEARFGPSAKWAYLPQVVEFEHPERTLYDTLLYDGDCEPQEARDRLGAFQFRGEDQFKTVSQLSGGERARLRMCLIMMSRANLLILDEPTNHLDLASREWIEEAVAAFAGALLFVSHDRYFIRRFATRIWEIEDGVFRDYPCDYVRYRRQKALANAAPAPEAVKPPAQKPPARDPKAGRQLGALERDIERAERQLAEFDARIDACASDYIQINEILAEKTAHEETLARMYAQWELAASALEGEQE